MQRAGRFAELDIDQPADEIEDAGKSEKRELASRMAVLLARLIKWSRQPTQASRETGLAEDALPDACPWTMEKAADADFWPE